MADVETTDVRGNLDKLDVLIAKGWVQSRSQPQRRMTVYLALDGVVVEEMVADLYNAELAKDQAGDEFCGFRFDVGKHLLEGSDHKVEVGVVGSQFRFPNVLNITNHQRTSAPEEREDPEDPEESKESEEPEESEVDVVVVRKRRKPAGPQNWSGNARSMGTLAVVGWLFDNDNPDYVFTIEAVENGKVLATATTGRFCDFAPPEFGGRTGFELQLPVHLLDGKIHQVGLRLDSGTEIGELEIDGADTGIGFVDAIGPRFVQGWAFSYANPSEPAEVEVFCDEVLLGRGIARIFRKDLAGLLNMNGFQGFEVQLDKPIFLEDLSDISVRLADGGPHLTLSDEVRDSSRERLSEKPESPRLKGHIDAADFSGVSGWAYDIDDTKRRIRINMAVNGIVIGGVIADARRIDLERAFGTDGKHGFHIGFPPGLGLRGTVSVEAFFAETGEVLAKREISFAGHEVHRRLTGKALEEGLDKYLHRQLSGLLAAKLPSVHVVVLNRDGARHLYDFLESFHRFNTYRNYRITVVDHGSVDQSEDVVKHWQNRIDVTFVNRKKNFSFSESNNFAVADSRDDLVFFVNNDIVFVQCVISGMVRYLSNDQVGMVGIKLRSPTADADKGMPQEGFTQHLGVKFGATSGVNTIGAYELPMHPDALVISNSVWRVPAVTAAAMMMRREDFVEVGGFDEGYFYSYEDVDLCFKVAKKLEKTILCANNLVAVHHRGATRSNEDAQTRSRYAQNIVYLRSRFGASLRQESRKQALLGERFLRLEPLRVAFLVSTVDFAAPEADFFTAYELGEEMVDLNGWSVSYLPPEQWYDLAGFDVVIAMREDWDPREITKSNPNLLRIAWARNWFDKWIRLPWLGEFDLVWTASIKSLRAFEQVTKRPVEVFRIATNAKRFENARPDERLRSDYCFTGSFFRAPRDILSSLDPKALPYRFSLFGHNWDDIPWLEPYWRGALPYPQMPRIYASTSMVVDDCNHTVKHWGSVNSRVFDALATGALVVTNGRLGSLEVFDELLPVYDTREELTAILDEYLSDDEARMELVSTLRDKVLSEHTYRHRAAQAFQSVERLFGQLRISLRYTDQDSFNSTFGNIVLSELYHTPFWVREKRDLAVEELGDDVVIWVSSEAIPQPKLECDQINILIHAGTGVNLSASNFDLVILPDDSCNLTRDDTPTIALFADAASRKKCFNRDGGALSFKDARLIRRVLLERMPEVLSFIEKANRFKTDIPSLPALTDEKAAGLDAHFGIDLVAYPDYRATNPYQKLLYADLPSSVELHFADIGHALKMQRATTSQRNVVFHLHWTSPILGIEQSPVAASRKLARFTDTMREFIGAGGKLVWTIHNVVPHEVLHPELEIQLCNALAEMATTIHVHSALVPEIARSHYTLPAEKIVVGPHGNYIGAYADDIDSRMARKQLNLSEEDVVFLFMGQIRSYKGLDRLLSAFQMAGSDRARLLIVGNPVNMSVDDVSTRIAADDRIQLFMGHVADDDLQLYFRAADFCVLPYERVLTSGSVYLALSFGLPVIAPNTGLLPEIIEHDVNGYLYKGGNTNALAEALAHVLSSPAAELDRLHRNAFSSAQQFDWDAARQPLFRSIMASIAADPQHLKIGETWRKVFVRHPDVEAVAGVRAATVVLHYHHLDDTVRCVRSLLKQRGETAHIYIVSNDQDADAFLHLCEAFPSCTVIQCDDNLGYAGGNNVALELIKNTDVDFAWIVNPDVVVPDDFLQRMVTIADTNEDVAIFGSKILFGDRQDMVWFGGGEIDWSNGFEAKHLYLGKPSADMPATPFNCDYITGASLFFRRSLIDLVGLIPEHYFLYCEETHWCMLAHQMDLGIRIFPETVLLHYKRSEDGGAPTATYLYYLSRASLLMCAEFHPGLLPNTERRLRHTGKLWLERVRTVNPDSYDLCSFAFELGIAHGLEGVTGRVDFEGGFGQWQETESTDEAAAVAKQLEMQ